MEILGIKDQDLVSFASNYNPTDNTNILDQLFPNEKTENPEIAYMKATKDPRGVMAQVYSYNTVTKMRSRVPFSAEKVKKMLIKDKIALDEKWAEVYDQYKDNALIKEIVFNDAGHMSDNVRTRALVMKGEVLATGKFTVKENNVDITVDFGVPAGNKYTKTWSSASADIMGDLQTITDAARNAGYALTRAVTSSTIIGYLRNNTAIHKAILGVNYEKTVSLTELNAFLKENYGFVVVAFDDMYLVENANGTKTAKRYFPANEIVFFGGSATDTLGKGFYGVTPTERMARISGLVTPAQSRNIYVYCDIWRNEDPEELLTRAEAQFVPVLADPNNLYIVTVS